MRRIGERVEELKHDAAHVIGGWGRIQITFGRGADADESGADQGRISSLSVEPSRPTRPSPLIQNSSFDRLPDGQEMTPYLKTRTGRQGSFSKVMASCQ